MKLFHISHTDLDGYGCQMLTKEYFKEGFFLNANYGLEVKLSINTVIKEIENLELDEEILIFITDVNLTENESKDLNKKIKNYSMRVTKLSCNFWIIMPQDKRVPIPMTGIILIPQDVQQR